jgi:hypothetical protein
MWTTNDNNIGLWRIQNVSRDNACTTTVHAQIHGPLEGASAL